MLGFFKMYYISYLSFFCLSSVPFMFLSTPVSSTFLTTNSAQEVPSPLLNGCQCQSVGQLLRMLLEYVICFTSPGRFSTSPTCSASNDPKLGTCPVLTLELPNDSMRSYSYLCVMGPAWKCAVDNSIRFRALSPYVLNEISDFGCIQTQTVCDKVDNTLIIFNNR